jgi:hypothetical protein
MFARREQLTTDNLMLTVFNHVSGRSHRFGMMYSMMCSNSSMGRSMRPMLSLEANGIEFETGRITVLLSLKVRAMPFAFFAIPSRICLLLISTLCLAVSCIRGSCTGWDQTCQIGQRAPLELQCSCPQSQQDSLLNVRKPRIA